MATKSIYKEIRIKDKHLARSFVQAIENCEKKSAVSVSYSKKVEDLRDPDAIRKIFDKS